MRLPRITTRRWMIAVAVVAAGLGAWDLTRRRQRYVERASTMAEKEYGSEITILVTSGADVNPCHILIPDGFNPLAAPLPADLVSLRDRFLYFQRMRTKYEYAARHPWLLVEPDPPEPE
jgi:hypothetical protein